MTGEHSVTLALDLDLAKLQNDVVAIVEVGTYLTYSLSSERKTYTKKQYENGEVFEKEIKFT